MISIINIIEFFPRETSGREILKGTNFIIKFELISNGAPFAFIKIK